MALQIFANNAAGYLASSITNTDVTITLQAGQGTTFPTPSGGTYFYITLYDGNTTIEICKCTARTTDTLTVVRGQEGTVASAFASGSLVEVRTTAATLTNFLQSTGSTATDLAITTADINGGTIDGTSIGATSRSTGLFTTIGASGQITSTVSTGTAPFVVASTTAVANLNASLLLGNTWAVPGTIGSTTPNTGAFTTLSASGDFAIATNKFTVASATGNTAIAGTLAVTGTSTLTGNVGIGGASNAAHGLRIVPTVLTGATQYGAVVSPTASSAATTGVGAIYAQVQTTAAAFTVVSAYGLQVVNAVKGAGSSITNQHGVHIADLTVGDNNYGITSQVSAGANKWNIYASGTAANYFAGNVGVGITVPNAQIEAVGTGWFQASRAAIPTGPNNGLTLGSYKFGAKYDATNYGVGAAIAAIGADTWSSTSYPTNIVLSTVASGSTTLTERLRIDSAGNVGIGTAVADGNLVVASGTAGAAGTGGYIGLTTGTNSSKVRGAGIEAFSTSTGNDHGLRFYTNPGASAPVERLRIDSAGNVGLGAAPSAWNTGSKAFQFGTTGAIEGFGNANNLITNAYRTAGGTFNYITSTFASYYSQYNGGHSFASASSGTAGTAVTWTQVLAVEKDKTLALQGATSQTGNGISFPATQVASSDANTLDDYEEGTFTPTIVGTSTAGAGTYTTQVGRYTKIGRIVEFKLAIAWTAHTGTGNLKISGLPFASGASGAGRGVASIYAENLTFTGQLTAQIADASTEIIPAVLASGAALAAIAMDTAATIYISGHYEV